MFTNVSVNGVIFQVANMIPTDNGFKVVGITANNTAEEIVVNFSNDFGVVGQQFEQQRHRVELAQLARQAKQPPPDFASRAQQLAQDAAAEAAYFGGEDVPVAPARKRGRPRKVVTE